MQEPPPEGGPERGAPGPCRSRSSHRRAGRGRPNRQGGRRRRRCRGGCVPTGTAVVTVADAAADIAPADSDVVFATALAAAILCRAAGLADVDADAAACVVTPLEVLTLWLAAARVTVAVQTAVAAATAGDCDAVSDVATKDVAVMGAAAATMRNETWCATAVRVTAS